ncbi:H(+)/Cl(-) exchange transporter ClcA [Desulfatirhabdium butyrativorans]|uniref:H(+)/Cl(-) exchange transporter ClcA n=1 Tax=Desulfatirhabdium butyrativorans TaxID=340467 RepID=UPI0003F6C568|nr:H(+)/Cl(-) exchange transporter ClcA [Desulfatirhabdium butyrativorans]
MTRLKRRILSLKGLLIGLMAGLISVAFRLCLEWIDEARWYLLAFAKVHGWLSCAAIAVGMGVLIALVVVATVKYAPEAGGSGIPHLKGYLEGFYAFRAWRIILVKFFGGVIGIGSGLALGREGPTIQLGAAVAKILGDRVAPNRVERKLLISAGAGAGLAAAFNAPMAGVFFILEELQHSLNQLVLVTAFVASVTADIVCRLIMGHLPVFHVQLTSFPGIGMFPFFVVLGLFIGYLGLAFNQALLYSSKWVKSWPLRGKIALALGLGVGMGILGLVLPEVLGLGGKLTEHVLGNRVTSGMLIVYFLLRFALTMIGYSTGVPGGIFAPMLLLGALGGNFFGFCVRIVYPEASFDPTVWGVLGMVGFFAASVRAPITGTILILEMTGAYDLLLPFMIVSLCAYSIPEYYKDMPVYDALLKRDRPQKPLHQQQALEPLVSLPGESPPSESSSPPS